MYLQGVNVTFVGKMAILQEIAPTGEDQIQGNTIVAGEDIEVVLEVIDIIIGEDIDLLDLQVEEVQEEALEDTGEEEVEEVGVKVVIIEGLEAEKVEINLMKVIILGIMTINHGVKKVEVEAIVIILISEMIKIIIIMKKQII